MPESLFNEMKRYVGFTEAESRRLQSLAPIVQPHLSGVVDLFYAALLEDPGARAVVGDSPEQIDRLRQTLHQWLVELFDGPYDDAYHDRRARIGRTHVRVGLPQRYMLNAMSIIRANLVALLRTVAPKPHAETLDSLHKLLDLDLAIMLETYNEDLMTKVRLAERERMAARLDEARHLASIGQLTATLAHEIKNPLAGISGAIQVLLHATPPTDPHRDVLTEVLAQIDRLDRAVKDTLVYARPKPPQRRVHRLGEVIDRVLYFLREEPAFRSVRIEAEGLDGETSAAIDEGQFQQIVSNLLLNSAHASPDGGTVRLVVTDAPDCVRVEVTDLGHGMPPDVQAHAFEPFYTTKSRGTGLGLPICKHIIEAHGGSILLRSHQGNGTTVVVELPKEPSAPFSNTGLDAAESAGDAP